MPPSALESLAMGLRQAGGVVSPEVSKILGHEDVADAALRRQVEVQKMQQKLADEREKTVSDIVAPFLSKGDDEGAARALASSGVPGSTKLSLELMDKIDARKARASEAAARRDQMALQLQQGFDLKQQALDQQKELALQRATDQKARDAVNEQFRRDSLALKERNDAVMAGLKQQGIDIQKLAAEQKNQQATDKGVQNLSKSLEKAGLPEADAVLGGVEDALKKTPKMAEFISGRYASVPDIGLGLLPGVTKEDADAIRAGRQAFNKLFNITLKNRSGSAVTNQELERLKQEFATGSFKKPQQLLDAVTQARNIINKHYAAIATGFGKDVLDAYNSNAKEMGARIVIEPNAATSDDVDALIKKYAK